MRAPDPLSTLAVDFRALSRRERRSVLRALAPLEREKLKALLDCASSAAQVAAPDPQEALSPCLRARLAQGADDGKGSERAAWQMTSSARRLLEQAARDVLGREAGLANVPAQRRTSLAETVLSLVSPRRWAR